MTAEPTPPEIPESVEILNGTAVWEYDAKKGTSKVTVKPGFPPLRSMTP
jgi:hypothetical protein